MPRTLGIIGSGQVGLAVAQRAVASGWNVVISNSRGPESLRDLVAGLGERAKAGTAADAAREGDLVLLAAPLAARTRLPLAELQGKVALDAMNYVPSRDGHIPELDSGELTSSELVQRDLPGVRVVKALNSMAAPYVNLLPTPPGSPDRSALPITGDEAGAKAEAAAALDDFGYDVADLGPLSESWRFSPNTPLYAIVYAGELPGGLSLANFDEVLAWFAGATPVPTPVPVIEKIAARTERAHPGVMWV